MYFSSKTQDANTFREKRAAEKSDSAQMISSDAKRTRLDTTGANKSDGRKDAEQSGSLRRSSSNV